MNCFLEMSPVTNDSAVGFLPTGQLLKQSLLWRAAVIRNAFFVFCIAVAAAVLRCQTPAPPQLQFTSSDVQLVHAFDWARKQALAYAFSGDPVGSWYEAALPGREAFCMRDVSHQSMGAQALGLADSTYNMLHHFAAGISASKDWCSYWEIDRENRPAPVDYESNATFWYNLPANFDVLDASYRMDLWTGDTRYVHDHVFDNFYDRTMDEYLKRWSLSPDTIMNRQRWLLPMTAEESLEAESKSRFRRGIPGYDESEHGYVLGIDLLAVEYAAYRDYAVIERMRGDDAGSQNAAQEAAAIKSLVNSKWWNAAAGNFYSTLDAEHKLTGSNAMDVLYWGVADEGAKTQAALKQLIAEAQQSPPCAVEPASHYAEIFYRYGATAAGYSALLKLASPGHCRQEYPEVSFSEIGAITTGVMGVSALPGVERAVETLPGLTTKTAWAELRNLHIGRNLVAVRHDGLRQTTFTNINGPAMVWRAAFPGVYPQLLVNGERIGARSGKLSRVTVSWVQIPVGAGDTVQVSAP